jgi:hypothetical protein
MFTYQSDNPHLRQVSSPSGFIPLRDGHSLCRTLDTGAPRAIYRRRRGELKSLCHWGQKKLLFSEIEFLSKYVRVAASDSEGLNDRVSACGSGSGSGKAVQYQYHCLYAGASPGDHIPYLCYLFPQVNFVLVDPRSFCSELEDIERRPPNVELRQQLMTSELIEEYAGKKTDSELLLISDIRSADWMAMASHSAMDEEVANDMTLQQEWHLTLKPIASMLKFRLPWEPGSTRYLKGRILLPVYGPVGTSEARLVVDSDTSLYGSDIGMMKEYDHQVYWEQMFYFNTVTRPAAFTNDICELTSEIDHCYDCTAETLILQSYLTKYSVLWDGDKSSSCRETVENGKSTGLIREVVAMSHDINSYLWKVSHESADTERSKQRKKKAKTEYVTPAHVSVKSTSDILVDGFFAATTPSRSKSDEHCEKLPWIALREPELLDLPYNSVLDVGVFRIGVCVPTDSALDVWIWQVLREFLTEIHSSTMTTREGGATNRVITIPLRGERNCNSPFSAALIRSNAIERDLSDMSLVKTLAATKLKLFEYLLNLLGGSSEESFRDTLNQCEVTRLPILMLFVPSTGWAYIICTEKVDDETISRNCTANRISIPMQQVTLKTALVVAFGELVISTCTISRSDSSSMPSGYEIDIELISVFELSEGAGPPQPRVVVDSIDVELFVTERLDFTSEQWRRDMLTASGIRSLSSKHS